MKTNTQRQIERDDWRKFCHRLAGKQAASLIEVIGLENWYRRCDRMRRQLARQKGRVKH